LAAHFAKLVHRFDQGPVNVRAFNAATKRYRTLALTKEVFADRLRQTLYATEWAAYVPYIIEQAYRRNYVPLGQLVDLISIGFGQSVAMGLNLSVTCAEDIPFITEAEIARTSAGSFEGDTRVRAQQRACAIWNVRRAPGSFVQPVRSDAPVLMISGAEDPATPPWYGTEALRYLPNGRQILIPHATHETELPCIDALIVTFVRTRNAKHLDASACAATSRRPPFASSMKGVGS
jgi:pimeloyl-ACP methyl ester carboxylesterase